MVHFNHLHPELCLLLMSSLSVQDIVYLAQTCSRMRELIRTHKSAFLSSTNPQIIPFPLGELTDDVGPADVFRAAAQAAALSRRLNPLSSGQSANVKKHSIFPLPAPLSVIPSPGPLLLDDYIMFRSLGALDFIALFKFSNGLSSRHEYGIIYQETYQPIPSRKTVVVALCQRGKETGSSYVLQVDEYSICDETFGKVETHFVMRFNPTTSRLVLSMRVEGNGVLATGRHGIVHCNWVEKSALWLKPMPTSEFELLDACFDSSSNSIYILCQCDCEFVLASVKMPATLPALQFEGAAWAMTSENLRDLHWNDLEIHLKKSRQPFGMVLRPRVWLCQTVRSNHLESLVSQDSDDRPAKTITHLRFNLREGAGESVEISHTLKPDARESVPWRIDNRLPALVDPPENHIYVLKLADSHNLVTDWVRLQLPENNVRMGWDRPLCKFVGCDHLRGRLLLYSDHNLHVIEY
ncbi:hypothetical protein SISSUDRAFT_1132207 [Sistotremastrum suecicum HHB10207 ss-3]|uniref:F-box domain-containing protein n=1 Tax=Sistotremastrum suecicum HHB10207 ss-3 TaxID=1314776 RepID=A0A165Z666_9AGAM|nr:hypothetical protein SISSUDRAFT_1132207 [Sistotremastrum suecicum HHB10207 ss-3]